MDLKGLASADSLATPLSAPRRVFFRKLSTASVPEIVARRLRSAIGLGIIADGERLPRELDLADQLGVSSSALREGLGLLRSEGLIETKPGKNGGSFVRSPTTSAVLVSDELTRLSANELRDLADWREVVASGSAALATVRSSNRNIATLYSLADDMEDASSIQDAAKALGRFHVELALGAQSLRLSMAQFMLHEEFDWLASSLLIDREQRTQLAHVMQSIVKAIEARDPARASSQASLMVSKLALKLARKRLETLAEEHQSAAPELSDPFQGLIDAVKTYFQSVLDLINEVGSELIDHLVSSAEPLEISRNLQRIIFSRPGIVNSTHGLGFLAEPGLLQSQEHFIAWWQRDKNGILVPDTHHVMDPQSDDFYDYTDMEIMTCPRETNQSTAMGPFIDHGGVDDYMITVSAPLRTGSEFLGIMAADTRVADFEKLLARWLVAVRDPVVVTNKESRILISNMPTYAVGNILGHKDDFVSMPVGMFGWTVNWSGSSTEALTKS